MKEGANGKNLGIILFAQARRTWKFLFDWNEIKEL